MTHYAKFKESSLSSEAEEEPRQEFNTMKIKSKEPASSSKGKMVSKLKTMTAASRLEEQQDPMLHGEQDDDSRVA